MDNILKLNNKPLKYIITKNKDVINSALIDNDNYGPLVIYEQPNTSNYREIYLNKYFLAGGYGAKSKDEQEKLSYIAENYNINQENIINTQNDIISRIQDNYDLLNSNKVTKGTINNNGDDISYNTFNFGTNNITLNELYNQIQSIQVLYKFEIYDIKYQIKFINNNTWYDNFSNVPVNSRVHKIRFTINGNTKDTYGIDNIYIQFYQNNRSDIYEYSFSNIGEISGLPTTSNEEFTIYFEKEFSSNENNFVTQYDEENDDKNYFIKDITIVTKTSEDSSLKILPSETITNIITKYPCYFIATESIILYKGNKIFNNINENDNNLITCLIDKTYELNIYENENINHIYLFIKNNLRLVKAEYYDYITNSVYDIIDFILMEYNKSFNRINYNVIYKIDIDNENNNYNRFINPPFLHKINNQLYLNTGKIILTFINSLSNYNHTLQNTDKYWITYNNDNNLPL